MCLRLDAKLGQCKLLDSVVLFYGRPFFQVAGSIALGLELPGFQGWSCQAFRGPLFVNPKAKFNYQDSWAAVAGNGKYCRRSAVASWLADTAKRGARRSGVC